jgi:hypothetical protein
MLAIHPATEARRARATHDEITQEVAHATRATALGLAARLDTEWAERSRAARRVDALRTGLDAAVDGQDPVALLAWVRHARAELADVSATLAPEGVRP